MGAIENRKLVWVLGGLLLLITAAFGWSLTRGYGEKKEEVREEAAAKKEEAKPEQTACASSGTYARLKEVAFEEALRLRTADPANLDMLANHSVVRMENPVVRSRDEDLNVTVCAGRFILELPPGAETAFGGQRRLMADVEYSAQAAVDGSGLVYQIRGAEPIIARLAAFDLQGRQLEAPGVPRQPAEYAEAAPAAPVAQEALPETAEPAPVPPQPPREVRRQGPEPAPAPRPAPPASRPAPKASPPPVRRAEAPDRPAGRFSNPSFNCRSARTRGERMVCSSSSLAARDRAMSSMFYSAMSAASPRTRAELRRTRDRFLAYRDRCGGEDCVAEAYEGRMREIRDIMEEDR